MEPRLRLSFRFAAPDPADAHGGGSGSDRGPHLPAARRLGPLARCDVHAPRRERLGRAGATLHPGLRGARAAARPRCANPFRGLPPSRRRGRGRACSPHHPRQGSRSSRPAPAWRLASEPSSPTASTGSSPPSSLRRSHSRCTATESAPPASCCLPSVAPAWHARCPRRRPWACTARSRPCRLSTRPTGGTLSFAPRCRSFPSRCSTQWLRPPSWRRTARPACHSTACVWRSLPHLTLP